MHTKRNVVLRIRFLYLPHMLSPSFAFSFPLALVSNVLTCECVEHFCRWILMANNNNLLSFGLRCGDSVAFLFI